jgi:hypothetical protein
LARLVSSLQEVSGVIERSFLVLLFSGVWKW